jgi:tRNA A37 N6-isopentenylltransferase MiaA
MDTRRYAKRQMTWFRRMAGIHWFEADDAAGIAEYVATSCASRKYTD